MYSIMKLPSVLFTYYNSLFVPLIKVNTGSGTRFDSVGLSELNALLSILSMIVFLRNLTKTFKGLLGLQQTRQKD